MVRKMIFYILIVSCSIIIILTIPKFSLGEGKKNNIFLFPVKMNGKYGFIEKTGKLVIKPQFERAWRFSENLAKVKAGNKFGYIDKSGNLTIKPRFDRVNDFSEGLALAIIKDNIAGFIKKNGNFAIKFEKEVSDARDFSCGLAKIGKGGYYDLKFGFINKKGKWVIEPKYKGVGSVYPYTEDLARVQLEGKHSYIDKTGKVIITDPKWEWAWEFSEGLARVKIDKKIGFIDKTGKIIIKPQFSEAYDFSEGLAKVKINNKWGYINKIGKLIIPADFVAGGNFSDGLAYIKIANKFGYIDKTGSMVIEPKFEFIFTATNLHENGVGDFANGLALVKKNGKWGYIDQTGSFVWDLQK